MHRKVDATATKWEPKFARAAAKALRHDERELVERMEGTKAEVEWTVIGRKWDEYFERFAGEEWREEFMPLIEGLVAEQGESWNTTLGMQFDVRNYLAEAWLDDYMLVFAQDINNTTKQDVSKMLQQAMREGWGIDEMSTQLSATWERYLTVGYDGQELTDEERKWFKERSPRYRRDMIARTETMRASNAGSQALFRGMGAQKKEWWATGDDRTRDSHLVAWQRYSEGGSPGPILMDQPFEVGGARLMQPGDPSGPPEETINCRCTPLPFMDAWAGTEEEIAAARADMEAEVARRAEVEAVVPEAEVVPEPGKVGGVAPEGADTTTEIINKWFTEGLFTMDSVGEVGPGAQGEAKKEIVGALYAKLVKEYGYGATPELYGQINDFIHQWAETSNDDDMRSLAIQKAASELFGVPLSEFTQGKIEAVKRNIEERAQIYYERDLGTSWERPLEEWRRRVVEQNPAYRSLLPDGQQKAILQAMYDNTQERLAAVGYGPGTTIRLRRGVNLPAEVAKDWRTDDIIDIEGNSLESWATLRDTAEGFAFPGHEQIGIVFEMDVPVEAIVGTARTGFGCLNESEFVIMGWPGSAKILKGKGEEWHYPEG